MSVLDPMRVEKNAWKGWVRASLITSSFACLMIGGCDAVQMAHIVLPDGQTVGNWMRPQIASAYENGQMPKLLPSPE